MFYEAMFSYVDLLGVLENFLLWSLVLLVPGSDCEDVSLWANCVNCSS